VTLPEVPLSAAPVTLPEVQVPALEDIVRAPLPELAVPPLPPAEAYARP
jgi:hypothetical protein